MASALCRSLSCIPSGLLIEMLIYRDADLQSRLQEVPLGSTALDATLLLLALELFLFFL